MKLKIQIDLTPQEAREFFGLPEVRPFQDELMETITKRMRDGMTGYDPMSLMKPYLPQNLQSLELMQKAFLDALKGGGKKD